MKKGIFLLSWFICLLMSSLSFAQPTPEQKQILANVQAHYANNILTITNQSKQSISLRNALLQFYYSGNVLGISGTKSIQLKTSITRKDFSSLPMNPGNLYRVNFEEISQNSLAPGQEIQLNIVTDNQDTPHGVQLFVDVPVPVQVRVDVSTSGWVQTIAVCNNSSHAIPLTNIEFDFNYAVTMPSGIWGNPWVGWQLASQHGSQVVLTGGIGWASPLQPDPNCANPLTIQFNTTPTTPAPTGPFVFKAVGGTPSSYGSITINMSNAPAAGIASPQVTVQGMSYSAQQVVNWGGQWVVNNLVPGSYTISAAPVNNGSQFFRSNPINVSVQGNVNSQQTIQYQPVPSGQVTVSLVNPPNAQEPITLTGSNFSFNLNVSNGTHITLPVDTYTVTSMVPGYSAVSNPNPLVVPTNTSLSITYQHSLSSLLVGYFQSWSEPWSSDGNRTNLGNLPSYVNVVNLSFMQPDATYQKGSMQLSGTGLQFSYSADVFKQAINHLHQINPNTKVLVAIGGASYTNWNNLNVRAIADFISDFGLDGVDIDYEPSTPGCALGGDNLIHCQIDSAFQSFVSSLRQALPRPYWLTVTGWSVAAYGQDQWTNAQPASQYTGMMLPLLRSVAGQSIDVVNVMSYDASNTYDPIQALAAYSHYFTRGPISMGVEVPPEAWGGHVYTLTQVNQLAQAVKTTASAHNTPPAMMLWSIQKVPNGTPSASNPSAQMMATTICTSLGLSNCNQPLLING